MMTIYNWITDPAHGWLTVPLAELRELGIAGDISQFSYMSTSKGVAYLEEDCDALRFIKAKGVDIRDREALSRWCDENTRSRYHDSANHRCYSHPVRNCEQYNVSRATPEFWELMSQVQRREYDVERLYAEDEVIAPTLAYRPYGH
jgi:hypothetical protein